MATDLEVLTLRLEASATKFERDMAKAAGAVQKASALMQASSRAATQKIEQNFAGLGVGLSNLASTVMPALAATFGAKAFIDGADAFIRINNSLRVAGLTAEEANVAFGKLFAIARATSTPVEGLATLYSRASAAQKSLNASSDDLIRFTNATAMALKVNGTSAQEATGALLQLSQALGGGKIQAEEYNSLLDGARPLLQAAADGMKQAGGDIGKLTALVKDGKVSSEAFFRAILAGAGNLEKKMGTASRTFAGGVADMNNALVLLFGTINENLGIINFIAKALSDAGGGISAFADRLRDVSKQTSIDSLREQLYSSYTLIEKLKAQIEGLRTSSNPTAVPVIAQLEKDLASATEKATSLLDRITTLQGRPASNGGARLQQAYDMAASGMNDKNAQTYLNDRFGLGGGTAPIDLKKYPLPPDTAGWQKVIDAQTKSNQLLQVEADTLTKATAAREAARMVAELEADAKEKNIPLTGEYRAQIDALAASYGRLKAEIAFGNALQTSRDRVKDLETEALLVGKTAGEQERLKVAIELTNAARKAGVALTPDRQKEIQTISEEAKRRAEALAELQREIARMDAIRSEAGSTLGSFFNDLANGVKTVDALRNAFTNLRTAILNAVANQIVAALLGPTGTAGTGLIGSFFGRAGGGPVNAGQPYQVGENGPELFVPQSAGRIVPNGAGSTRMGDINIYAPNSSGPELMALRAQVISLQRSMQKMAAAPGKQARNMAV